MRHDLLLMPALAVAPRSPGMREAPGTPVLVPPAGFAQRLPPRLACAVASAVALAAVAAAAHQHLRAAPRAGEHPCAASSVALSCTMHAWLAMKRARVPVTPNRMDDPLASVPYCARTRGQHEWGAAVQTTCPSSRSPRPS